MKYIKKFENNTNKLDLDYIKECFVDYLGNHTFVEFDELYDGRSYVELNIILPGISYSHDGRYVRREMGTCLSSFDERIQEAEALANFYKEMQVCVDKVKIEFPNVEVSIDNDNPNDSDSFNSIVKIFFCLPV